jgi:hypothetical protein
VASITVQLHEFEVRIELERVKIIGSRDGV